MTIKNLLLFSGALALSVSSLSGLPTLPASAQTTPTPAVQPQRPHNGMRGGMKDLNLTDAQKAQIKQLHEETRAQVESLLTSEQKAQLQAAKQSGTKKRGGMKGLNLTEAQKTQMRQIHANAEQKMKSILTPEQQAILEQKRQSFKTRRQQAQPQGQGQGQPGI